MHEGLGSWWRWLEGALILVVLAPHAIDSVEHTDVGIQAVEQGTYSC
jgi:hypothetical protein